MPTFLKTFLTGILLLPVLDFIWIGLLARGFYLTHLSAIGRIQDGKFSVLFFPAVLVYLAISGGISYFVLPASSSVGEAALRGAIFGAVLYATYDFTNLATLKDWNWTLGLVDIVWGTFLCAVISALLRRWF